jgi:hypothetical protein
MATDGAPAPGTSTNPFKRRPFLIGLGIGAVPLALSLVAGGLLASAGGMGQAFGTGVTLGITSGALWVLLLVVTIVLLFIRATREVALGLLAAAVASPAIAYIGCGVILPRLLRPGP